MINMKAIAFIAGYTARSPIEKTAAINIPDSRAAFFKHALPGAQIKPMGTEDPTDPTLNRVDDPRPFNAHGMDSVTGVNTLP
jgi:hypothetical protein